MSLSKWQSRAQLFVTYYAAAAVALAFALLDFQNNASRLSSRSVPKAPRTHVPAAGPALETDSEIRAVVFCVPSQP